MLQPRFAPAGFALPNPRNTLPGSIPSRLCRPLIPCPQKPTHTMDSNCCLHTHQHPRTTPPAPVSRCAPQYRYPHPAVQRRRHAGGPSPSGLLCTRATTGGNSSSSSSSAGGGARPSDSSSTTNGPLGFLAKWQQNSKQMQEQLKALGAAGVIAYGACSGLRVCARAPAVATGRGVVPHHQACMALSSSEGILVTAWLLHYVLPGFCPLTEPPPPSCPAHRHV